MEDRAAVTVADAPATPDEPAPTVRRIRRAREHIPDLGHQPALDGLRAVAVAAVLVYHARFSWATGGFLGVSLFFTLSGFLITSLLLREWSRASELDLRRFWGRRFRRLLPASWFTIALVLAMGALGVWDTDQMRALRGDVPFALAEIINWHFIAQGRSYGTGFTAPSPLEHFWSLAVEQQFYVVLPLLLAGLLLLGARWGTRVFEGGGGVRRVNVVPAAVVLAVLGVASAALNGWWARDAIDRAYFGTVSRLFELVAGALLACVLLRRVRVRSQVLRRVLVALGIVGLGVSVWLWHVATVSSSWMYPWGFLVAAVATTALITGALQGGVLGRALSLGPLLWLGRISYGVYLLHWPIFLWLTPQRVGWAPWPLFALRLAVTLTAAELMFRLLERPVRLGGLLPRRQALLAAPVAAVALLGATALVTSDLPAPTSLERASTRAPAVTAPPKPLRVLVLGDELAASAVGTFDVKGKTPMQVDVASAPGCGLALGGWVRLADGTVERDTDRCGAVKDLWAAKVATDHPDVVVLWAGLRDVADRRLSVDGPWLHPGDPALDDFLKGDVGELVDAVGSAGARVVLWTTPHVRNTTQLPPATPPPLPADPLKATLTAKERTAAAKGAPPAGFAENEDARIDAWNGMLGAVAASRGVPVIDVAGRMRTWPGGEFDPAKRAAGVGVTPAGATDLAGWLAPQLRDLQPTVAPPPSSGTLSADAPNPPAPPVTPRRTDPAGRPAEVLVVGDSVAYGYGYGLTTWSKGRREMRITNGGQLGCPIARGGSYRFLRDIGTFEPRCDWATFFPKFLREQKPTVVALTSGIWEVVDRRFAGDDRWRHIGQPEVDRYILNEFLAAIDTLGSQGATVALLTYPHFTAGRDQGYTDLPESDPARVDRLNELLRQAASLRPGVATVVDVQGWLAQQPGGEQDPSKRVDGLHFQDAYVPTIAAWLGPQLTGLARNGPPSAPPAGG